MMTDAIGGYFGEEELTGKFNAFIHEDGVLLNLGRNAFKYICNSIPGLIESIYIPRYTCPVVWDAIFSTGKVKFYRINKELEIEEDVPLDENDYIVVNNYFGIKDAYVERLSHKYGNHLIIDNAQAFFAPVISDTYSFYSPRKYFGVPDGGVAYLASNAKAIVCDEHDDSSERLAHLKIRRESGAEAGFAIYQQNEHKLDDLPILQMSEYTHNVLKGIDYETVKEKRRANYQMLHEALGAMNELPLPTEETFACPMVYPFIGQGDNEALRKTLRDNRIYAASYWPGVGGEASDNTIENILAKSIIPLPIDQRYNEKDMKRIINVILDKHE